ncbi:hypothetical protein Peur_048124 [Populus x canadensis]
MEFFNEILTSGCSPHAIVYYNMISGFSQDGRMDGGSFVLSKWKEVGFRPDTVCYDVLIGGFCWKNKFDRVFALLKEMDEAGLKPAIAYNTLIALYQQNWGFKVCPESPEKDDQGRCGAHCCYIQRSDKCILLKWKCEWSYGDFQRHESCIQEWLSAVGETEKLKNFVGGYDVFHSAARKASARTWTLHTCKFAVFVRDQEALQFPVSTVSPSRL